MVRYAGQKRRATTQKTYAMDICYSKVVTEAKMIHRSAKIFYIVKVNGYFSSVDQTDYDLYYLNDKNTECWKLEDNKWRKTGHCM